MAISGAAVAIVGTGRVGSTLAYTLMLRGLGSELILHDIDEELAQGHALDLNHGMALARPARIVAGTLLDCARADVVIMCGGIAQRPGESRQQLVHANVQVVRQVVSQLTAAGFSGILLMATNPVDVLAYAAWRFFRLPARQVLGSGTVLDSARLRYLLGEGHGLDPRNIHAYVLGEHGDSELAAWSLTHVAGLPASWLQENSETERWKKEIMGEVRQAAGHIIARKGATYFAIALGLARVIESIVHDQNSVLTVSALVEDYYGISGVYLGLPCVVNRNGVARVLKPRLSAGEAEQLRSSARAIRGIMDAARDGFTPETT